MLSFFCFQAYVVLHFTVILHLSVSFGSSIYLIKNLKLSLSIIILTKTLINNDDPIPTLMTKEKAPEELNPGN